MSAKRKKKVENTGKIAFAPYVLIAILGLGLYANTLGHEYALDDDVVFLKNSFVQEGFAGIDDIISHGFLYGFNGKNTQSYRPIVTIIFAVEHAIFGNEPFVGHLLNILFYILCGSILFALLKQLFKQYHFSVPLLMTLLFMAHPIHTEAVANIKGRDDIMHFLFIIISLWQLTLFAANTVKTKHFAFSLLAFFGALLSKEMAVTFLAVVPLMLYVFYKPLGVKKILTYTAPYAGVLVLYMIIRSSILDSIVIDEEMTILNNALAATDDPIVRLTSAIVIFGKYLGLLFFPHPLSFDYSFNQIPLASIGDWRFLLVVVVFAGLIVFAIFDVLKKKGYIGFGILYFFITMSVVANIVTLIGAVLGERFLFTPSVGFVIALPIAVAALLKVDLTIDIQKQKVFLGIFAVVLVLFGFKTMDRNVDWQNNSTLFAADVESAPNSTRAHSSLGANFLNIAENSPDPQVRAENFQKGIKPLQRAVEILPSNSDAWYNMGVCYNGLGQAGPALKAFLKATEHGPGFANAWNNAGVIYFQQQQYDQAITYFEKAAQLQPNNADALGNIGAIYHNQGDLQKAVTYYDRSLNIGLNPNVLSNAAKAYESLGNTAKAQDYRNRLATMR